MKASTGDRFRRVLKRPGYNLQGVQCIESKDGMKPVICLIAAGAGLPAGVLPNVKTFNFYTVVDHQGEYGLWYINMYPGTWKDSALEMMRECVKRWVKIVASKDRFDYITPEATLPEPDWSGLPPFADILALAFKDNVVKDANHPVIRKLLGYTDNGSATGSLGLDADGY